MSEGNTIRIETQPEIKEGIAMAGTAMLVLAVIALMTFGIHLMAFNESERVASARERLVQLISTSPEQAVQLALSRGDHRLLAVSTDRLRLPGLPEVMDPRSGPYRYRVLEGTVASPMTNDLQRLQNRVIDYCARYNKLLLQSLEAPQGK